MKYATRLVLALFLAGGIAAVVINQNRATRLRSEHEQLLRASEEIRRLKVENSEVERLRTENGEVQKLLVSNKDLPKLRNEVRQLRRQAEEMEKLRAENLRFSAQPNGPAGERLATPQLKGFISRSSLADVGLSTPEAALQTMFWAMCHGNLERIDECMWYPGVPPSRGSEAQRQDSQRAIDEYAKFPGFAFTGKQEVSPDEVILQVQTSARGPQLPVKIKRVGNEWKINQ